MTKHCEWCGLLSDESFYRFIGEAEYIIFLKSVMVSKIDLERLVVHFTDGRSLSYVGLVALDTAASTLDAIPHIFCSETCEDRFLEKYSIVSLNDTHKL